MQQLFYFRADLFRDLAQVADAAFPLLLAVRTNNLGRFRALPSDLDFRTVGQLGHACTIISIVAVSLPEDSSPAAGGRICPG